MKVDIYNTDKKYDIIYADPPWTYGDKRGGTAKWGAIPYQTMDLHAIGSLPIKNLAGKDCALFLWVTMPMLREGLETIQAGGFKYKTCAFCWVKTNAKKGGIYSGMGHWTNANAELCLLATKGHPHRVRKDIKQIVMSPVGRHSKKPDEVRDRIEALMGGGKMIELFAREAAEGWDRWGLEAPED